MECSLFRGHLCSCVRLCIVICASDLSKKHNIRVTIGNLISTDRFHTAKNLHNLASALLMSMPSDGPRYHPGKSAYKTSPQEYITKQPSQFNTPTNTDGCLNTLRHTLTVPNELSGVRKQQLSNLSRHWWFPPLPVYQLRRPILYCMERFYPSNSTPQRPGLTVWQATVDKSSTRPNPAGSSCSLKNHFL